MEQKTNIFKEIFSEHWEEFQRKNPKYNTDYYSRVINKMLGCGEYENGYAVYRCTHCGQTKKVAFSCKSSFCLSCAKAYTENWVEYISKALFTGMKYRHVVLTMPGLLGKWFYRYDDLLSELMRTGYSFYEDVISVWLKEAVEPGCIVVLQTSGRNGRYNIHLHIICTSGGMTAEEEWKGFGYIDFNLLHTKWQYHLLSMLRKKVKSEEMEKDIEKCWENYPKGFVAYIEKGKVPGGGRGLARYLAKYVVSPPISLKRIIKYDGRNVKYWYRDHHTEQEKVDEVDVLTFIGRMVQHILPKGFQRIRYYGLHATCKAGKIRKNIEDEIGAEERTSDIYEVTGYRERIKKSFGLDPLKCSKCGEEMELESIWHPEYGCILDNWDKLFSEEVAI